MSTQWGQPGCAWAPLAPDLEILFARVTPAPFHPDAPTLPPSTTAKQFRGMGGSSSWLYTMHEKCLSLRKCAKQLPYFLDHKMHLGFRGEKWEKIFEAKNVVKYLITSSKAEIL